MLLLLLVVEMWENKREGKGNLSVVVAENFTSTRFGRRLENKRMQKYCV